MLNLKSLFTKILTEGVFSSGSTYMTGEVLTSFKNSSGDNFVGFGYYDSTKTTIPDLLGELRYSSGAFGSVNISSTATANSVTISTGGYWFLWMPHRKGGTNGNATSDNCNYGTLLLTKMALTFGEAPTYTIRMNSSGGIATIYRLTNFSPNTSNASLTATANNYYSLNTNSSKIQSYGQYATVTLYIQCTTETGTTQTIGSISPAAISYIWFPLTNSAGTTMRASIYNSTIKCDGGYSGHGFQGTITYITAQ